MFNKIIFALLVIILPLSAHATPALNFSDIDSGPKTGNTDGVGSGAIVTVWGNDLGATQGTSKIYVGNVEATAIYYWKNADGDLPGGPAELSSFHKMQEIAFSIPAGVVDGATTIKVNVNGVDSNTLPFTVRGGNIRFIKAGGNNSNTGTWTSPWASLAVLENANYPTVQPALGDIVYSVGVGSTSGIVVGRYGPYYGSAATPVSLIAYPNTAVAVSGQSFDDYVIFNYYNGSSIAGYVNFSKISVTCNGSNPQPASGIMAMKGQRIVGVEITGPTVYGGYQGAIGGSGKNTGGGKYLGVYIHHYGYANGFETTQETDTTSPPYTNPTSSCATCTKYDQFQHLYYITNRSDITLEAYEIAWNHLTDNPIWQGIHLYDMGATGGYTGTMKIHNNVVKNQRGGAIESSLPASSTGVRTNLEVYNNIIISDVTDIYNWHALQFNGSENVKVYNNTIYGYKHNASFQTGGAVDYRNNIMVDTRNAGYIGNEPDYQSNNLFFSTGSSVKPVWATEATGNLNVDPQFVDASNYDFQLGESSPALSAGIDTASVVPIDFFGQSRSSTPSMGAIDLAGEPGVINGTCGSTTTSSTAPTANLCATGTASSVSGTGPWSWTCAGSDGGSTADCSASVAVGGFKYWIKGLLTCAGCR